VYDDVSREVEYLPYKPKPVGSLQMVYHDRIQYPYKYTDRSTINSLFALRKDCDDILIIKRGLVTDTSYANIVFKRKDVWVTPWSALLKGTMRAYLLERNLIVEEKIRMEEIKTFEAFKLINALLEFDAPEIEVSHIVF
jgi:4-amino-4-deoxychorismate lyase